MNRAELLYTVLADGRLHSRHEIFRVCGEFFLTNNAASELRAKRGVVVVHTVKDGEHFYQLESALTEQENAVQQPGTHRSVREAVITDSDWPRGASVIADVPCSVSAFVLDAVEDTTRRGDPPSSLPGRADGMDSAASNTTVQLDLFEGVAA